MADETIRIDYITEYITHGHGQYLKDQDEFNKKLKQQGILNKSGQASQAEYRKELERTHPRIAQITKDLDALHKQEAKGKALTDAQVKQRGALVRELEKEQRAIVRLMKVQNDRDREERKQSEARLRRIREEERELTRTQRAEAARLRDLENLSSARAKREADELRAEMARSRARREQLRLQREEASVNRSQLADIENLVTRMRGLDDSFERNRRHQSLWARQVDNLTMRSTRRAISGVHEWTTTLATIAMPAVPQFLSLLVGALGTVGAAAVGAAASIAKLAPGIGAVGLAITGVVQTMGTWKLAMRDFGGASGLFQSAMFDDMDTFLKKVQKVTPAAQLFAVTLRTKMRPAVETFQRTAQRGIFGGLNVALDALLPRRGLVNNIIGQTSQAMGGVIGNLGQELARPEWATAFKDIGTNNARWITELGKAAIPTARALRDLTVAATPILDWTVKGTARLSKMFGEFIAGRKASGELARGVQGSLDRLKQFADIAGSTTSALMGVVKAGMPMGDMITKGLQDQANAAQRWTRSFEGQRRMAEWFMNMQPAVRETGLLVRDLAMSMARVSTQSSIDVLVHQLRADLLPTLEQTMMQVNQSMGPLLVETVVNLLQALTTAMGPNGPVTMMIQGINQLAQAFQKLNEVFPGLRQLVGLLALFRLARLTGAIVGVSGLVRAVRGSRMREQARTQFMANQPELQRALGAAYPAAMVQTRVRGRFGPKVLDPRLLPPEAQQFLPFLEERQPTLTGQLLTRAGRRAVMERFATERAAGMGRFRAGLTTLGPGARAPLAMGGGVAIMIGGQLAGEAASRMGAGSRAQSIIGMAGMGAGMGAMMASPTGVGVPVGAAVGAVVGGLAGLGMSFLGAKKKVDEFAGSLNRATFGVAAARQGRQQLAMNQRQLQFGVRGAQIELRSAVAARDALGRGMTGREFEKFTKTDVYKAAQLRVDQARTNLSDLKTALQQNTEQLKIANARVKQQEARPRALLQAAAGRLGGKVAGINQQIRDIERGGVSDAERFTYMMLLRQRTKALREFASKMTQASRDAASASMPYWSRMFKNAISVALERGGAGPGFTVQVTNRTAGRGQRRPGGPDSNRAGGGRITWGNSMSDSAPAMLSKGEFVVTGGGEQMLESMTFPGVLNWLEGAQPPHFRKGGRLQRFLHGGRVKGLGDMVDRRHRDPGKLPMLGNRLLNEEDAAFYWEPWKNLLETAGREKRKPKIFPPNSELGRLQRAMSKWAPMRRRRGGRIRGYADGGFARTAILAPFMGSFSSGFSAGEAKDRNAIASLYSDLVSQGIFAAADTSGSGKGRGKNKAGQLPAAAPAKAKQFLSMMPKLTNRPFVEGGGHGARPGPTGPNAGALMAQYPGLSKAAAEQMAAHPEKGQTRGFDSPGWVRWALAQGGFGDVGRLPQNLLTFGKNVRGNYMSVLAKKAPPGQRAFIELGTSWFGQVGVGKSKHFGSTPRKSLGDMNAYSRPGYRRGGRVGRTNTTRSYATGGRVTGVPVPTVTGTGGDAANKQWASSMMGFLQNLTNATLGGISRTVASLQSQVVAMTMKADTSEAGQNLMARVSALLDAAEFALGERLGRMQARITAMADETAAQRSRLERMLQIREIDPESPRGLAQSLMQLRRENTGRYGLRAQIRAQRGLVQAALGTPEEQQLRDRLTELIAQAVQNATDRILTRRALARARDLKPFNMASEVGARNQFELQRLTLNQQLRGVTGDAASAQLSTFMKNTMLPNLKAQERAANRAMVREKQRTGTDSAAYIEARRRWEQAVLDRLGLQVQLAEEGNSNTEKVARALSGQLSFDFMGQSFTDAITSGVGV